MDTTLFPTKEEWGSGDEAMDNKLSIALKKTIETLSLETIGEFYSSGLNLRPRALNPSFHSTIELVTKALLYLLSPDEFNDHLILKMKGAYHKKSKVHLELVEFESLLEILKNEKVYRYKNQIDFHYRLQNTEERNPFVRQPLKKSKIDVHAKILMKDFRFWLQGQKEFKVVDDEIFSGLKSGQILVIKNFGELWFHNDSLFTLVDQVIL